MAQPRRQGTPAGDDKQQGRNLIVGFCAVADQWKSHHINALRQHTPLPSPTDSVEETANKTFQPSVRDL